jgi:hypothetical protein
MKKIVTVLAMLASAVAVAFVPTHPMVANSPSLDLSKIAISVTPTWKDPIQHPVYPGPDTYRVRVGAKRLGENHLVNLGSIEMRAGEEKDAEVQVGELTVRTIASINGSADDARVSVRGYQGERIVFQQDTHFWLPKRE